MTSPVSSLEAIERFERAVTANGYRTCDDHTEAEYQAAKALVLALARKAEAYERENAELREALKPFAIGWADENGWTDIACQKDRIVDWFGPSDFRRARSLTKEQDNAE
jgi:hypothetical protein